MFQNIFISNRSDESPATVYIWGDGQHGDLGLKTYPYSKFAYAYKLDPKGDKETIFGDRVSKTYRWGEGQRGIFESDIPRETRVLTDLYLDTDEPAKNNRVLIIDIEVAKVASGFATVENADGEITAIGCYAQTRKEYTVFLLDKNNRLDDKIVDGTVIRTFESEQEMLSSFLEYYRTYDPTILTGWNICQYDMPYLYRRLEILFDRETAHMLSPIGLVKFSKMRKQYQFAGVACLDYYEMYQKFTFARRPSYRLHDIGLYEVNLGKIEYEGTLDDLYNSDIDKFIEYNIRDIKIVERIDDKMKLIDLAMNISALGHTQPEDYKYSSKYIEGTILVYLHRQGRVVPDKRPEGRAEFNEKMDSNEEGFKGAYVKEPEPGLYEWVYNLDLQSLYPSIIMTLNISPETKVGKVEGYDVNNYMSGKLDKFEVIIDDIDTMMDRTQFEQFMHDSKFMIASNGILYRSDKLGVIPEVLNKWFADRLEFKALLKKYRKEGNEELSNYYDRRQHVQKILLNSIYGVLGLPIFRFYDLDNALAVTATGQDIIKTSAKIVNKQYQRFLEDDVDHCIYIDTDSLYFSAKSWIEKEGLISLLDKKLVAKKTVELAESMKRVLNTTYDVIAKKLFFCDKHRLYITGEAVSETAFWVAKKRYAMWKVYDLEGMYEIEKPKVSVKGLDVVRSSFPPAFQKFMSECLDSILHKAPKETLDGMILELRKSLNGMPFNSIARNTSISNISDFDNKKETGFQKFPKGASAHVKAAVAYNRWLRKNKLDKIHSTIKDGDKIKYIYLKPNDYGIEAMALKGHDDPEDLVEFVNSHMDFGLLFEKELSNKIEDFYSALSWGKLPTDVNQSASKFFDF